MLLPIVLIIAHEKIGLQILTAGWANGEPMDVVGSRVGVAFVRVGILIARKSRR